MAMTKITSTGDAPEKKSDSGPLRRTMDLRGFIAQLERAASDGRMDPVRALMKQERFLLHAEVTGDHAAGVVASLTDPSSFHACRLDHDGRFLCCARGLHVCDGLQGKLCEHLVALLIGLVQFGMADATTLSGWVAKTAERGPTLDIEVIRAALAAHEAKELAAGPP